MIATLDQTQAQLPQLLERVLHGEEVVITQQGQPVARLTALPTPTGRSAWLGKLARLRASGAAGPQGTPSECILEDLRAERGT
ncbi:MAG: Antitoxin Phd YefM, type toxin-antitoxin system [Verrucomicrobiota bacterium]|jgi:prevent-host-death family protein